MKKPIALDLFSGGGGSTIGLLNAGFDYVVGVDIKKHKHYPGEQIVADIRDLDKHLDVRDFDLIWASPPCQRFSIGSHVHGNDRFRHPDLIPTTREAFKGHPFTVIENVPGSPIHPHIILTGPTVHLPLIQRKRYFELSFWCWQPQIQNVPPEDFKYGNALTVTTSMCSNNHFYRRKAQGLSGRPPIQECKHAMGIPQNYNFTYKQVGEAVPPPYAEYIAKQAIQQIIG